MSLHTEEPVTAAGSSQVLPARLWRNRNFILLSTGQYVSSIGDFVYSTVLLVWVFSLTHSAAAVSGIWAVQYLAYLLIGPLAGVFVDRWNRLRLMQVSDLARAVVTLFPLLAPSGLFLPAIYVSVFLIAALERFFTPARAGLMQVIVTEGQQATAASVGQTGFALAMVAGPGLGSLLYFAVGPIPGCLLNAASFLLSAVCLLAIRVAPSALRPGERQAEASQGGVRAVLVELRTGFTFALRSPVLRMVMLLAVVGMLGAGSINALDIVFVSQRLHVSSTLYGPLAALGGLGLLVGVLLVGLVASRISPRRLLPGSVGLTGGSIVVYAWQTQYAGALVASFICGLLQAGIDVGLAPLVLNTTPRTLIGRVQSVIETSVFLASILSITLSGYLGQFLPVHLIFIGGGVLLILAGGIGWFGLSERSVSVVTGEEH
jgi:MFS family permease